MSESCDILVSGTGSFGGRIALDIASTAKEPVHVVVAGRNLDRLNWLVTAGNARASMFGTPARFSRYEVDLLDAEGPARMIADTQPRIVAQAASIQTSQVIASNDSEWAKLVAEGGLSVTAPAQTELSLRVAEAITESGRSIAFFNCGFPDLVNGLIKARGHDVISGFGNIAILSTAFAGAKAMAPHRLKMLAHYQNLAAFRQAPSERGGKAPRVWIDGEEVRDVYGMFEDVQLTRAPAIEISGASGVPLLLALAAGKEWQGHMPGPDGKPGGYPVRLDMGRLVLDLPAGLSEKEAEDFNLSFERTSGMIVHDDGRVSFTGKFAKAIGRHMPELESGFEVKDLKDVFAAFAELRQKLQ